jgi:rare lipoprotein A
VRVEYVGRAPIEGSDDRVLLATLREGRPAQMPSQLMVASATSFVPSFADAGGETPIPPERPFALGGASARVAAKPATVDVAAVAPAPERSVVKLAAARTQKVDLDSGPQADTRPGATFAPAQNDSVLGLMSGRGLY